MRYGSQEPTTVVAPVCDAPDVWDGTDAARFAERFGLKLDPWQIQLCELWMRRGGSGKWAAGTWGVSVPRQNGKNGTLEAVELYGMVVLRLRFLHTAHEVKTARKAFRRLKHFFGDRRDDPKARFPELNRLVWEVRNTNGQEAIFLRDPDSGDDLGAIEVVARSEGSARGFTNDVLVIDEAQHLSDEQLEASRPAISAAPSGDPVAIYMGTPPKPEALSSEGRGAAFVRIRSDAVSGKSKRAAWMEFGIDADLEAMTPDEIRELASDKAAVARVNPALGRRLFEQTLSDELTEMGPRSFCRERLNVWPQPQVSGETAVSVDSWRARIGPADPEWRLAGVGLDMDLTGRLWAAVASFGDDPLVHVELLPDDLLAAGVDAAVERIRRVVRRRLPVVMPADSGATVLDGLLRAKGVKVYRLNINEQSQSASGFAQALKDQTLTHLDDPLLEQAVRESAREKMSGGRWRFKRTGELAAAPLLAIACARHGAVTWAHRPKPRDETGRMAGGRAAGQRISGRR